MGWFGKLTLGSIGLFLAGPLGAIAGAALGHHLFDKEDSMSNRYLKRFQEIQRAYENIRRERGF